MVDRLTRDTLDDDLGEEHIGFNDDMQDEYSFEDGEDDHFESEDEGFEDAGFAEEDALDEDEMALAREKAQKQFKTAMMAVGGFVLLLVVGGAVFLFGGSSSPQQQASSRPVAPVAQPEVLPVEPILDPVAPAPVEPVTTVPEIAQVTAPTPTQVDTAFGADLYDFGDVSNPAIDAPVAVESAPPVETQVQTAAVEPMFEALEQKLEEQNAVMAAQEQQIAQQRGQIAAIEEQLTLTRTLLQGIVDRQAQRAAQPSPTVALEKEIGQQKSRIAELERKLETDRRAEIAVNLNKPRLTAPSRPAAAVQTAAFTPARAQVRQTSAPVVFRGAQPNQVWLSPQHMPDDLQAYRIGDVVPGLGRLTRIGLSDNNRWYIETEGGRVTEFNQ